MPFNNWKDNEDLYCIGEASSASPLNNRLHTAYFMINLPLLA